MASGTLGRMATQADVRRIALGFPGTVQEEGRFAFALPVKGKLKGFAWVWLERIDPKKARVPQPKVLAVRTASLDDKEFILAMDSKKFFTEPHYNGYPAVLVRLAEIPVKELRPLLESAWRCTAPKELLAPPPAAPRRKKSTRTPRR
jgi:hypothetical protein